jgi:hypothetical protein
MGFNKRFITEDSLKHVYKEQGYEGLVDYITKPDAILVRDEFSNKVVELIKEKDSEGRLKILMGNE